MTELVVEFRASAYMTDTQLSRLKRIPKPTTKRSLNHGTGSYFYLCAMLYHTAEVLTQSSESIL
jgi:hypothetical protein